MWGQASLLAHQSRGGKCRVSARQWGVYETAYLLLAALATGKLGAVLANGAGFGLFMLGAALARSGFRVERAYQRRSLARAPRLPLKARLGSGQLVESGGPLMTLSAASSKP